MKKWTVFVAVLGGFLQSYVTCAIAGALCFICGEFCLSPWQEGIVASVILLGALVGSALSGSLADWLGRRTSLIFAAAIYFLTAIAVFLVSSFSGLLFLRFATGIGAGMTSILVPLYLAENAPPHQRGAIVASFQLSVTLGTLVAYLANLGLSHTESWRLMFALAAIPALFQLCALPFMPESPCFTKKMSAKDSPQWKTLLNPTFRYVLGIGIALCILQQFCGINGVIYFTPKIFAEAGFSSHQNALLPTLLIGIVNVFSTLLALFLIDKAGRRKLLLLSQAGLIAALFLLAFGLAFQFASLSLLSVLALIVYIAFFSIGLGPVTWVLISEIYPLSIRAKAIAVMTFLSWSSNALVVLTFPSLISIGIAFTFFLYAFISLFAFLLFYRIIPETKNKSLEELEKTLYRKK